MTTLEKRIMDKLTIPSAFGTDITTDNIMRVAEYFNVSYDTVDTIYSKQLEVLNYGINNSKVTHKIKNP